jgi:RND family efflux transporter MFP subunit
MLRTAVIVLAAWVVGWPGSVLADSYVTASAKVETYQPQFRAYAQVVPIRILTVEAGITGMLQDFSVEPGQRIAAGDVVGRIGGADQAEAMKEAQAKLAAAQQEFQSAEDQERSVARTYPKFADRTQLDRAKAALAAARAKLKDAKAELLRLRALSTVTSPAAGRVISLQSANGDRVSAGSALLTIQPEHDLWVRAVFYGTPSAVLSLGRRARFDSTGGETVPVRLARVIPSLRPDGGLPVAFDAADARPDWRAGETGEVTITGTAHRVVSIPTSALILDQGKWWVLEAASGGLRRQMVQPGPSQADRTLILQGLSPGATVVVQDAYLLFHRDFGQHYVPPD